MRYHWPPGESGKDFKFGVASLRVAHVRKFEIFSRSDQPSFGPLIKMESQLHLASLPPDIIRKMIQMENSPGEMQFVSLFFICFLILFRISDFSLLERAG